MRRNPDFVATPESERRRLAAQRRYHARRDELIAGMKARRVLERKNQPWVKLIQGVRSRSAKKGIPCDLTIEWAKSRWTGNCEWTNLPFNLTQRGSGPRMMSPSIDRIDPSKGYTQGNCRIILFGINAMKAEKSDEDVLCLAKAILSAQP